MNQSTPVWLPFEKETLLSILESLIYEDLLATRQKFGKPAIKLLEANFWTNVDLDFNKLLHETELMKVVADFISHFWLPKNQAWSLLSLPYEHASALKFLHHLSKEWYAEWAEDGNIALIGVVTPHVAQLIKERRTHITQIIAFLGPNVGHVCKTWGFQAEQYKVLVSKDTLKELGSTVRWNMIYGKVL